MIEVLAITSEIYPLVKTGGLADVAGALPGALSKHGVHIRTLVPGYPAVLEKLSDKRVVASFDELWGGPAQLLAGEADGLDVIVIDAKHLYDRPGGPYQDEEGADWPDNWARFAALAFVGAQLAQGLVPGYAPEIVHAHDWQAALAPTHLKFGPPTDVKTVITIHNLAFQGRYDAGVFGGLALPEGAYSLDGVEYYGGVGFLKGGLATADAITTVSPTYAAEIRTPEFGMGLEGLLETRADVVTGILNGIDTQVWNPSTDPHLAENYRVATVKERAANKRALEEVFKLESGDGPLFTVISRLTWQKGIDLLVECIDGLVAQGGRLCVLGTGDADVSEALLQAAGKHSGKVGVLLKYDEPLSHLCQGGADAIIIPSRFEPCGLTQLFGLHYGCVPVVSRVGGLADTVIDANEAAVEAGAATGVQLARVDANGLAEAIRRTISLFGQPKIWKKIQRKGMKADVSWDVSAERYAELYRRLIGESAQDE